MSFVKRLVSDSNQQVRLNYQNKREELNYLYESQTKELQRAATLDQSQKDVELIVQRHMLDIDDWMLSCNKQINLFRKNLYQSFWTKIFQNDFQGMSGPPSSQASEENKSVHGNNPGDWPETADESNDLIKFKSQLGIIHKMKLTILIAQNLKEDEVLDVNQFRKVRKIPDKMPCNLLIGTFDDNDDRQKLQKFMQLTEMTPIENNFPFKIQMANESVEKLMIENEFVFGSFPLQVKDTIDQLLQGLSAQDTQIFEDQDLIVTQHAQISSYILKD